MSERLDIINFVYLLIVLSDDNKFGQLCLENSSREGKQLKPFCNFCLAALSYLLWQT